MTIPREQVFQTITFIIVVLTVDRSEHLRPAFPVDRRRELPLNLLAMASVILLGEKAKTIAHRFFQSIHLESFVSIPFLRSLPGSVKIILAIVLTDFSLSWVHRAMHGKLLWPTHRFHHSIGEIWWLSGARTSFTHLCLFAAPQIFIAYYLLDLSTSQIGMALSFAVGIKIWLHANIRVNLGHFEEVSHGFESIVGVVTPPPIPQGQNGQGLVARFQGAFGTTEKPLPSPRLDQGTGASALMKPTG